MTNRLLMLLLLAAPLAPSAAHAAGKDTSSADEDLDSSGKARHTKTSTGTVAKDEVVREVVRGFYAKADVGGTGYVLYHNGLVNWGTALALCFGDDFVDSDRKSIAWEITYEQGVHSGVPWDAEVGVVSPLQATQGDIRSFIGMANVEYSVYPTRRFGIGARLGAGVMLLPLLMNSQYYQADVEPSLGDLTVHKTPHPLAFAGPTFEYYTKLSHFSVGADLDVMYALGFDLGIDAKGYLKYTF